MFLLLGLTFQASQQVFCRDEGFKYITNYTPKDYERSIPQNWWILQDRDGVIYVGNNGTLLIFDGVSWRSINVPNKNVRSIAIDDAGTVYISGYNEFGYLVPDEQGLLQYKSLSDRLKNDEKNFKEVWKTYWTKQGVYFQSKEILFRWDTKEIKKWPTKTDSRFHFSYVCEGDFYIKQDKKGLMKMVNDQLEEVPGGDIFADKKIYMMVPYESKKLLIGTRENGFYIYDGTKAVPFPTEVDDYLKEKKLYHGIRLSSPAAEPGDFALATLRGGLVIINSRGLLKKMFTMDHGLQDNDVKYVYEDSQENLWLALGDGISKIEYKSPISIFDKRSDLPGLVLSVIKHRNKLYAGTTYGLYFLELPDSFESPGKFRSVPGIFDSCWSLLSIDDSLLAATSIGVFQMGTKSNLKIQRLIKLPSYFLLQSRRDANRIWVGTNGGLVSLYSEAGNGQWAEEYKFKDITQEIRTIVENKNGNLWLGTPTKGVIKVDFAAAGIITDYNAKSYQTSPELTEGEVKLPPEGEVKVFWTANHTMFATRKGIYRFDERKETFIPDSTLSEEFTGRPDGKVIFFIVEDRYKDIWLHSELKNFRATPNPEGIFTTHSKPFLRIPNAQVNVIYPDPDGYTVWFGGNEGLIHFDKTVKKNYSHDFTTLIRRVEVNGKLIFGGYKTRINNNSKFKPPISLIDYEDRNLHFEFAAPFFEDESAIRYQYFLEGYDDDWSDPTTETKRDYTNLDSGLYTFRVIAKNIYENPGREDIFQFKIFPPWYTTWWAFVLYAIAAFLVVFFIVKWRSGKLKREKHKLERVVKERTKEIEEKNQQLEEQSEKLKEMDKVKSRFFANISHEFRTPLTLIMGPLEQILSGTRSKKQKEQLNLMLRNSHRLLTLINQLLDLSRFDSGKMRLQANPQNIIPFLKGILASFNLVATQKKIDLIFSAEEEDITLYFDAEKLEQVIGNLLSNALKFTLARGKITVAVKKIHTKGENTPPDFLDMSISDTGVGISKDQLAHIFDRFYQARGSSGDMQVHNHKGTGIGLALTKELVSLHHGNIDVHSSKGKGTEFIIRLPMGKTHLHPDEIAESPGIPPDRKELRKVPAFSMIMEKEEEKAAAQENEIDIEAETQGKNVILVVEDNADVRQYIRGALEPLYTVKEAVNGREGIDRAKELIPDLVISDIMMPEADGYELCNVLKTDIKTCHIPVILLTAKASEQSIVEGLESGADDYITKPFNTKILCTRIKNLIDLRRHMQERIQRELVLQPAEIPVSSMDETFINEVQEAIEKNLAEPEFNVEELGKKLYMSRATLYRKIQALTGESPREFIKSYRLKRGAQLLKANFGNVTEVAFEVGFSSTAYFSKCFKEKFQQLPHTFQVSESSG